jgi:hypothetical protein
MSIASRRVAKLDAQAKADAAFLNERGVHITMTRDSRGRQAPISCETLHAIAEVVRAYDKSKGYSREAKYEKTHDTHTSPSGFRPCAVR